MKTKQIYKSNATRPIFVCVMSCFFALIIFFAFLPIINITIFNNKVYADPQPNVPIYINVDSGNPWYFAKTDSNQIVASHPDGQLALFTVSGQNKWSQAPSYYYPGATATCGAYIEYTPSDLNSTSALTPYSTLAGGSRDSTVIDEKYILVEPANCNGGTEANTEITLGLVGEELSKRLANINNGKKPTGCPGYGNVPVGNPSVTSLYNYWCPEREGIVLQGEYVANPTAEQIAKLEAEVQKQALTNVSTCSKEENKENPECTGENPQPTCEDSAGNWGFIICFLAEITGDITNTLENNLYSLLRTPELAYGGEVYQQWNVIRNIATSLLILIGLIAIAAQVFNLQFISTYTMKKIIPKLVIATILIFLSYYLLSILVTLTNAVGDGVGSLIMGPFDNGQLLQATINGDALSYIISKVDITSGAAGGATFSAITVAIIAFITNGGIGVAIMGLFVALFAVLMGFFTLVLRNVMIVGLVMIAPLAIVAWILPGTEKWFKQWWGLLSKLLIMFPLVIGLISFGRVGAYLIANMGVVSNASQASANGPSQMANILNIFAVEQNGATGATLLIMVIVAYFAPYFFIPAMFKTAGGAFAKISGGLQSKGKSLGNSSGKFADNAIGSSVGRLQSRKNNRFTRGLNRAYRGAIVPNRLGGRELNAKAIAESDKAIREQDQQMDTLTRASISGLSREKQEKILQEKAKGSDKAAARSAIRTMKNMGMNSELRKVFYESDSAKRSILELQSTDDAMMEYFQKTHRDMSIANNAWNLDGTVNEKEWEESMANMTAPEVAATHKSAFAKGKGGTVRTKDGRTIDIGVGNNSSAMSEAYKRVQNSTEIENKSLISAVEDLAYDPDQYRRLHENQQKFITDLFPGAPLRQTGVQTPSTGGPQNPTPSAPRPRLNIPPTRPGAPSRSSSVPRRLRNSGP